MKVEELKKAKLEKGDILILRTCRAYPVAALTNLKKSLQNSIEKMGFNEGDVLIMILEEGIKLEIVKTYEAN